MPREDNTLFTACTSPTTLHKMLCRMYCRGGDDVGYGSGGVDGGDGSVDGGAGSSGVDGGDGSGVDEVMLKVVMVVVVYAGSTMYAEQVVCSLNY